MRAKITKRSVDALRPTEDGREAVLWDAELKGFGVRIQRGSVKSYILHYRIGAGRGAPLRKLTIGKHGSPWTPETARAEARRLLAIVAQGKDPGRRQERNADGRATLRAIPRSGTGRACHDPLQASEAADDGCHRRGARELAHQAADRQDPRP